MVNCLNKVTRIFVAFCASTILLLSANACTKVDDHLGNSLLPKNQLMKIRVATLGIPVGEQIKTYTYKQDSLVSSRLGSFYLGQEKNAIFGARKNDFILQFLPYSLPYKNEYGYGLNPIIDSLFIVLPMSSVHGDTTVVQKFDVYAIEWDETQEPISKDSVYYSSFPVDEYKGVKLFEFKHTGKRDLKARLFPTTKGQEYLNSIVTLDEETYKDDTLFLKKYKGLYVTPASDSPVNASVYACSVETAYMSIHARSYDTIDINAIRDTILGTFVFYDQKSDYQTTSINMVDFDYSGTPVEQALASTELNTPQTVTYVQTMGGVTTRLNFTDEIISALKDLRYHTEEGVPKEYPSMMINQAEMHVWITDGSTEEMNKSIKRVGSYLNLTNLHAIPDYQYVTEKYYQSQNNSSDYQLSYNGYLNRSSGYYKLDITSYIQQLVKKVEAGEQPAIKPEFYLGAEAYGLFSFGESVLKGFESSMPIKIRVTYTLVDGSN